MSVEFRADGERKRYKRVHGVRTSPVVPGLPVDGLPERRACNVDLGVESAQGTRMRKCYTKYESMVFEPRTLRQVILRARHDIHFQVAVISTSPLL